MNKSIEDVIYKLEQTMDKNVKKSKFIGMVMQVIGLCKLGDFSEEELKEIFRELIFQCTFEEEEDSSYLVEYINALSKKSDKKFTLADFEEQVLHIMEKDKNVQAVSYAVKVEESKEALEEPCDVRDEGQAFRQEEKEEYIQTAIDYEAIALADELEYAELDESSVDDTGILDGSFWNTPNALNMANHLQAGYGKQAKVEGKMENSAMSVGAYLIRENSGQRIDITKEVFALGKDAQVVDYAIPDNSTISRKHAEIIKRGTHFFVCDKGSTNKTYVMGREVKPEEFVEIHDGTKIKISNEEFTFHM